jgi:hypothetical protein
MKMKTLLLVTIATLGLTASTMAQNLPNYVPANGLVGWWPFNGNANDESGNGNDGTVNGATSTIDRFNNLNNAYQFNGINNYINIPYSTSLHGQIGTVNAWIYTNGQLNDQKNIFSQSQGRPQLVTESDNSPIPHKAAIQWKSNNGTFPSAISENDVAVSQWTMITGFYSTDTFKIYINGNLEQTFVTNLQQDNCSQEDFQIGGFNTSGDCQSFIGLSQMFNGTIDDIGFWNRALTEQEISDLYNGNICYQTITVTDTLLINMGITGFNPVTYNNTIKIFPNPANNHITIDYGNFATMNGYQLKIENSLGQQLFQTNITQQTDYLSLNNWGGNGLYFVHIIDAQGNTIDIRKIVLQ